MRQNAQYLNKKYAKMAMTVLVDRMIHFQTFDEPIDSGHTGFWVLGLKYIYDGKNFDFIPIDMSDINEFKDMLPSK